MIKLGNYFVVNCHTGLVGDASYVLQAIGCLGKNKVGKVSNNVLQFLTTCLVL